jgi:hypothetical protein
MNNLFKLLGAAACAAVLLNSTLIAADPSPPPSQVAPKSSTKAYPFRGTVDSIDSSAQTITLEGKKKGRILHINSETVLEKDGKPARFDEVSAGDYARGLVSKVDGTREVLVKASFGPKPEPKTSKKGTASTSITE